MQILERLTSLAHPKCFCLKICITRNLFDLIWIGKLRGTWIQRSHHSIIPARHQWRVPMQFPLNQTPQVTGTQATPYARNRATVGYLPSLPNLCSLVLIIPKEAPHENKGHRFVVELRQLNARTKTLRTWFSNWEKCGQNSATQNLYPNWTCVTCFGKWVFTQKDVTKHRSHVNMGHFNIAFCLWAY